ncbi:MAG: hypothetical protein ACJ76F_01910 [Bacteroidia bacterium]
MSKKKVLLICYSFPPFPGIGGRRWAKFAKYLTKKDFELFVIGAEHRLGKKSNWSQDIDNNKAINYFAVRTRFFSFFHDHNFSFLKKIKYRLSKLYLENKYQGNFYDKVLSSNDLFYEKAKELIMKHEVKNLVITIAPNRLVEVGVKLKKEFPDLNFIMDVRDPWNICLDNWDHKELNDERKAFELKSELNAVRVADKVLSVCKVVTDFYAENIPEKTQNFIFIPNGFDPDEINTALADKKKNALNYFVYTGILYDISIGLFNEFLLQVSELMREGSELLKNTEFHFYIPEQAQFKKSVEEHGLENIVKFFDLVPLSEIQKIISQSSGGMLFLPPQFEFSLSTKFYEYVSYGKKILLFSNPGEVAEIIKKHGLGYVMLPGKMAEPFKTAIMDLNSGKELPEHTFNLQDYSIANLTEKIIPYFK